jgi:hypothetical protein
MTYAILDDGRVANMVEADEDFASAQGWLPVSGFVDYGDRWDGSKFIPFRDEALSEIAAIRWSKTQFFAYDDVIAYAEPAMGPVMGKIRILEELDATGPVKFKLNATTWRDMTLSDLKDYGLAIDAFMQPFYDYEAVLAGQIEAAASFEVVNAIDLMSGWPA